MKEGAETCPSLPIFNIGGKSSTEELLRAQRACSCLRKIFSSNFQFFGL